MDETPKVGKSIKDAVGFLLEVSRDTITLSESLSKQMRDKEWENWRSHNVSRKDVDKGDIYSWAVWMLFRPRADKGNLQTVISFSVFLNPPAPHNEALCVILAIRLAKPSDPDDFEDSDDDGYNRIFRENLQVDNGRSEPVELRAAEDFFPTAENILGFTVSLSDLDGEAAVNHRLVVPAIGMVDSVPFGAGATPSRRR